MIKPDEVLLIFGKWKEESATLRLVAWLASGFFSFERCRVVGFKSGLVGIELEGKTGAFELDLTDFAFEYGEPPQGREEGAISALIGLRGTDERVFFMELPLTFQLPRT